MKKINYFIFTFFLFILTSFSAHAENKIVNIGDKNAKITVKVFSSLTCPHCANFHNNIFEKLKEKYIDKNLVRFELHGFPLDLAALNAEIIVRCQDNNNKKFEMTRPIPTNAVTRTTISYRFFKGFIKSISQLRFS